MRHLPGFRCFKEVSHAMGPQKSTETTVKPSDRHAPSTPKDTKQLQRRQATWQCCWPICRYHNPAPETKAADIALGGRAGSPDLHHTKTHTHTHTRTLLHAYIHTCMHTYILTYIHTYRQTYMHTHTHIHTCITFSFPFLINKIHT